VQQGFVATEDHVGFRIQDREAVPFAVADAGTVILNGWDLRYTNGDHQVKGLGTAIFNIREAISVKNGLELSWEAGGVLSDKNGDDGYKWCYWYTLVLWSRGAFDAVVPWQHDVSTTFVASSDTDSGTALLDLPGRFPLPPYHGPQAVVPRGFGFLRGGRDDTEVLQVGFDLGPPTPVIAGNEITWTSQTIFKDDSTVDSYVAAALVTVLSGTSVELWQPPTVLHLTDNAPEGLEEENELHLHPHEPCGWTCSGSADEQYLESYSVENVPFDYAIPVLTGWDIKYAKEDHHVKRIGVYLVEFEYVPDPTTNTGTLHYTIFSTLRDDSNNGYYGPKYQISVLGFNKLGGDSEQ
jgi:hypothetical protein